MSVQAILFDFDNTLADRGIYAYRAFRRIIRENMHNQDPVETEAVIQDCMLWDQGGTVPRSYVAKKLQEVYGIQIACEDFQRYWLQLQKEYAVLYPDTLSTLKTLKERGYRLGCVTDGWADIQRGKLETVGLTDMFEVIVVSEEVQAPKPRPQMFEKALQELHLRPEETVYVGDVFAKDVLGAYRLGIRPVWFWPEHRGCSADVTVIHRLSELLELFPGNR